MENLTIPFNGGKRTLVNTMAISLIIKRQIYMFPPLVVKNLRRMIFKRNIMHLRNLEAWNNIGGIKSLCIMWNFL